MSSWRWLKYFAPYGLWALYKSLEQRRNEAPLPSELEVNRVLRGREAGKRCFVLGNGPSAKQLDLGVLEGEAVISVSNGYLHAAYDRIKPRYHCVPQVTYGRMTEEDVVRWFREMHEHLGDAVLFLNETEIELVRQHRLFEGRTVHYVALRENFDDWSSREIIDLAGAVPRVESVPVMVLMVAMYLGFEDIYLLGVDHDHFRTGRYTYAFDLKVQQDMDFSVALGGEVVTPLYDEFQSLARLWRQYRVMREIAQCNDVRIYNANPGGALDEFPRVQLLDVVTGQPR